MSGQRNKKPSDVVKARQEYLDNLSLEVQLNDANEQVVTQYKETGQVPPISQMKDTRTTSQKLADIEKLKISLIKDLEPIADPQFAQQIVGRLVQSPLNIDNRLLIFAAQRIDDIVKNLQKTYKYGIKGDANDAEMFVSFVNKMYSDKNNLTINTKAFLNRMGTTEKSNQSAVANQHSNLVSMDADFNSLRTQLIRQMPRVIAPAMAIELRQLIETIKRKFEALINIMPVNARLFDAIEKLLISEEGTTGYNIFNNNYDRWLYFVNHNIPNLDYAKVLISDLYNYVKANNYDYDKIMNILTRLDDVLAIDMDELRALEPISTRLKKLSQEQEYRPDVLEQPIGQPATQAELASLLARTRYNLGLDPAALAHNGLIAAMPPAEVLKLAALGAQLGPYVGSVNIRDIPKVSTIHGKTFDLLANNGIAGRGISTRTSSNANGINAIDGSRRPTKSTRESFGQGFSLWDTPNPEVDLMPRDKIKYRMVGKGLPRADYSQGIDPSPRYIKFGRYMINNKKLNDNVLSLRRSKGSTIATIPATKMTSELGGVIKKIVGGGVPSFDELNALTDAEKRYLFKVSQEADIYDKIKIPTPSKDEEEKDIHAFNVMKGEILAGNNSKELVAKFKALLNKLSKNNILPKSQVREILEELLELGY